MLETHHESPLPKVHLINLEDRLLRFTIQKFTYTCEFKGLPHESTLKQAEIACSRAPEMQLKLLHMPLYACISTILRDNI